MAGGLSAAAAPGKEARLDEQTAKKLSENFIENNTIDPSYYEKYDVKRGLRNADGTGVVVGVSNISNVHGYVIDEGDKKPVQGTLTFRGYDIRDLVNRYVSTDRFGFEDICYLLMMGELPTPEQSEYLNQVIADCRELPSGFTAEHIMNMPSDNIMNMLQRCVALLYAYDSSGKPDSLEPEHEMEVAVSLLSRLPRIAVLSYYAKRAYYYGESMIMHRYIPGQSTAETFLSMLRPDRQYTHEEAKVLDIMLMIHAEHGGGNNSTFACRTLTSAGTDAYSAYAGAIGSLKGFRHGGANIKVMQMLDDIEAHVKNWEDDGEVADYLRKIVAKDAFDGEGLIYGMGHAVYTLSDPRAEICRYYAKELIDGTEHEPELNLLEKVATLAPEIINEGKKVPKVVCPNVDMFSGMVYRALGIPYDLFTPLFACSRMAGWSAHRFEEMVSGNRIMRPAYKSISTEVRI